MKGGFDHCHVLDGVLEGEGNISVFLNSFRAVSGRNAESSRGLPSLARNDLSETDGSGAENSPPELVGHVGNDKADHVFWKNNHILAAASGFGAILGGMIFSFRQR